MYKRILIHVDGSVQGAHHVRHCLELARSIGAHPILLHVKHEPEAVVHQTDQPPPEPGLELLRRKRNQASEWWQATGHALRTVLRCGTNHPSRRG